MTSSPADNEPQLTKREKEVLKLMAQAYSNRDISEELTVSIETVRTHTKNIYYKLDASGRQAAILKAIELGLLEPLPTHKEPVKTNLLAPVDKFIGRKNELSELATLFRQDNRLVTIVGVGGVGKTRLAIEYASQQQASYEDGVYVIHLEAIFSIEGIVNQLIDILSIQLSNQSSPKLQLLNFLSDKNMLLVIDNWEHLIDGAFNMIDIIDSAPDVDIIATSREKLPLRRQTIYHLDGLRIPQDNTITNVMNYDAVQLLYHTAIRIYPDWEITEDNIDPVYQLCHQVEGMPLGIILATNWLDVYPLAQIVKEIQTGIDFLATDYRGTKQRHQSMRAVFDWTWALLTDAEQNVFMKLSVFRNGFTASAVENIADAKPVVLQSLINKALLHQDTHERYHMHELVRQYAEEKLSENLDVDHQTRNAHAEFYVDIAGQIMSNQLSATVSEVELENLYVGWYRSIDTLNFDLLWRAVSTYGMIAYQFEKSAEMKVIYDYAIHKLIDNEQCPPYLLGSIYAVNAAIHQDPTGDDLAKDYIQKAYALFEQLDLETARNEIIYVYYHLVLVSRLYHVDQSLELLRNITRILESRALGHDPVGQTFLAYAYSQQSIITYQILGNMEIAQQPAVQALQYARDIRHQFMIAINTGILGSIHFQMNNLVLASDYFQESEEAHQSLPVTYDLAHMLSFAGGTAVAQHNSENASRYLIKALEILLLEDGLVNAMLNVICAIAEWKQYEEYYIEATEMAAFAKQSPRLYGTEERVDKLLDSLKNQLHGKDFEQAVQRGQAMSYDMILREMYVWLED